MSLSISDLFTAPSSDDIRAAMVSNLVSMGVPADKWRAGGVASTMLTVVALSLALTASIVATLIQGFFLPTATGNSLKLLAKWMYGVDIPAATFASGQVTFVNSSASTYSFGVGEYSALNPTTKVTYVNGAPFTINPNSTLTGISLTATTAGSAGNAAAGAINQNVSNLIGVTVTNPASFVGVDAPNDAAIRTLCLNKLGAMSVRGPRTAYAYAIQTATNPVTLGPVNINRWTVSTSSHVGDVTVVVASPSGAPDPNDVTGVGTNIEAIARPEAVTVTLLAAVASAYAPTITIYASLPSGLTTTTLKAAIDAALVTFISTYPIGGKTANDDANPTFPFNGLFASAVYAAIGAACAAQGATFISGQGAYDLGLLSAQVAGNSITTIVRSV